MDHYAVSVLQTENMDLLEKNDLICCLCLSFKITVLVAWVAQTVECLLRPGSRSLIPGLNPSSGSPLGGDSASPSVLHHACVLSILNKQIKS